MPTVASGKDHVVTPEHPNTPEPGTGGDTDGSDTGGSGEVDPNA